MLLFFIGILIAGSSAMCLLNTLNIIFLLLFAIGLLISSISAFQPLSGWEKPITIKKYNLALLTLVDNKYVIQDKDGNLTYKYRDNGVDIIKTVNHEYALLEICEKGEKTVLKKSKVKPKRTIWAFPILSEKYVVVLCVPKSGVIK